MDPLKQKNKQRRQQEDKEDLEDNEEQQRMNIEPIQYDKKINKKEMQEEEWEDEQVNIDFDFLDPNENQKSSVKMLINGYLDGQSYRASEFADLIVGQVQIGTMVGTADQEDDEPEYKKQYKEQSIYGFVTILNLKQYSKQPVIKEIISYILEKSKKYNNTESHQIINNLLSGQLGSVGLLVNERVVNLVPQVVPVLHEQFLQDLSWLSKEDPDEFKKHYCDYLICMTQTYKAQVPTHNPNQKKIKTKGMLQLESSIYKKFEDYLFLQKAEYFFSFEAFSSKAQGGLTNQQEKDTDDEICTKVIYIIKMKEYADTVPKIHFEIEQ